MTDELVELKERVGALDKQIERMANEFRRALGNGEITKARTNLDKLISEAKSTKEFTKALLSKFQLENKDDKVNLCIRLLRYVEDIENVILALKEV